MDPNVALRELQELLENGETDEAFSAAYAIWRWLATGGCAPDWGAHELATQYYADKYILSEGSPHGRMWRVDGMGNELA